MEEQERSTEESLDELEALLETAGGICCGKVLQNRPSPDPRSFLGEGKVRELKELAKAEECTLAVFDNELSPSQQRALSDDLGLRFWTAAVSSWTFLPRGHRQKKGGSKSSLPNISISCRV